MSKTLFPIDFNFPHNINNDAVAYVKNCRYFRHTLSVSQLTKASCIRIDDNYYQKYQWRLVQIPISKDYITSTNTLNSIFMKINMSSSYSSTQTALLTLFLITLLSYQACCTYGNQCSGFCGNHNVSHPFRLQDFSDECGSRSYNLSCEGNNQLVLYLLSGKYNVLSINYNNYTIRIRDSNILDSLPRDSLSESNFTDSDPYTTTQQRPDYASFTGAFQDTGPTITHMIYVKCKNEFHSSSSLYVDTASCATTKASNESSHLYAIVGTDTIGELGLEDGCGISLLYMTSWPDALNHRANKLTCSDIHSMLLYGFELSWLNSLCDFASGSVSYYYADSTNSFVCGRQTTFLEEIRAWIAEIASFAYLIFALHTVVKILIGIPVVAIFLIYKWRRRHLSMYHNIEEFLQGDNNIVPIRYSYKEIKKMTQGFKVKLGKGGYGSVFRGQLRSGRLVAIKMLDKAKADGQEFINEVATLGRIHHVNVVHLIGYCVEGSNRALIYEFMQNGSLEKYIHAQQGNDHSLNCAKLYEISRGIARGIEYLHKGCNMQILHFDIKPHNILLDDNFNPKVSDFGLAKLYPTDNSIVSLTAARGTIGYMAPELFYRSVGGVSYKADVYSFGMLLMEMAGRRRNLNEMADHSDQLYFPFWVYDQLQEGNEINIENATEEEMKLARKMMKVGLWCIQTRPNDRPSMNRVVQMLEGEEEDFELPPKPYLYPQDSPAMEVGDHSSSTRPSIDPSGSDTKDSISLLPLEVDRSV